MVTLQREGIKGNTMSFADKLKKVIGRTISADPFVADLVSALSKDRVHFDATQRFLHSHDASVFDEGNAGPVCFPVSTQEVQAIMRIAKHHGRSVVARGAGTGLAGGAVPLGAPAVVAMTKMNQII